VTHYSAGENMFLIILRRADSRACTIATREVAMANPFVHVELNTSDITAAKAFYGALFGWTLQYLWKATGQ